ncbi:MAG TPA: hypothetical protein VMD30_13295 [Tepidisphaeraceae bacterium]|nr:hypothetical protein [Tepidisphaeraceae bacterium]
MPAFLAITLPFDPSWLVAGVVVLICLAFVGMRDLGRFSISRAWAVSGVCFRESMRRRILWLIPLAIVGVMVVCQFQRAIDDRDALRATTKVFLFATGLVVTLSCVLLACTNLPREIENRVIFTVVTKPMTRMELIAGKIIGFARVSAVILIIMGLFTYGYVELQSMIRQGDINARLAEDATMTPAEHQTLEHYKEIGLLTSSSYVNPGDPQFYARQPGADGYRSLYGGGEQTLLIPFDLNNVQHPLFSSSGGEIDPSSGAGNSGLLIGVRLAWRWINPPAPEVPSVVGSGGPQLPGKAATPQPTVTLDLVGPGDDELSESSRALNPWRPTDSSARPTDIKLPLANEISSVKNPDDAQPIYFYLPSDVAQTLLEDPRFWLRVSPNPDNAEIIVGQHPAFMMVSPEPGPGDVAPAIAPGALPADMSQANWNLPWLLFCGRMALTGGQQLRGVDPSVARNVPVATFHFHGVDARGVSRNGLLPMEVKAGIESDGEEIHPDREEPTVVRLSLHDPATGTDYPPAYASLENLRTGFASVPIGSFSGKDFDIIVSCESPTHYVDLGQDSLSVITGYEPFIWNLGKSLFILWLLTVLVITVSLFCSIFLSWPIAVVLTIVLLLGHWAVTQMSDVNGLDLGRSISTDMGLTDHKQVMVVTQWVDAETTGLNAIAVFLPDIDNFAFIQDLEQGVIVSLSTLGAAAETLLVFGLPIAALAYVIFKYKEVAP